LKASTFQHLDVSVPRCLLCFGASYASVPPVPKAPLGTFQSPGSVSSVALGGVEVGQVTVRRWGRAVGRRGGGEVSPHAKAASTSRTTDSGSSASIRAR